MGEYDCLVSEPLGMLHYLCTTKWREISEVQYTQLSPLLSRIVLKIISVARECQYGLPQTDACGHALEHDQHRLGHLGRSPAKLSKGVSTK
jgi:hypothetical protein